MSDIQIVEKISSILISLLILFNGFIIKKHKGSWLYPGALFSLFWFCFTFFPLVILFKVPVDIKSQLYILTAVILFSNSYRVFNYNWVNLKRGNKKILYDKFLNLNFLKSSMLVFILLSIICLYYQFSANNLRLNQFLNSPIEFAEEYSKLRYSLILQNTAFNFLSFVGAYVSAVLGGFIYFSFAKSKSKYLSFFCFLPSLIIMFTQSAKGSFFLSLFLFLGVGFAYNVNNKSFSLFSKHNIIISVKSSFIFLVLLILSFLSRGFSHLEDYQNIFIRMKYLFATYFLGHIYAFSDWFNSFLGFESINEYDNEINGYGYYTFNSITRYYDLNKEPIRGVFKEYFEVGDNFTSNLYTIYRGLIMDFGLFGSLIAIFLIGFVCHTIYYMYIKGKLIYFSLSALVSMFAFFYMSFMGSFLYWTVSLASFFIVFIILIINFIYVQKRN